MKKAGGRLMTSDRPNQLLGELLSEAGLLEIEDLREAANIARSQSLPIGKVLMMSGYISKELLQAAIEVQSRVKDNLLNYDLGLKALKLVATDKITLSAALAKLGAPARPLDSTSNRLGALLLDADLLTKNDFDAALEESTRCGLPLGRVLANLALIPERIIDTALNVQRMLRSGKISKEEAVKSIKENKIETVDKEKPAASQTDISPVFNTNKTAASSNSTNMAFADTRYLSLHHMLRIAGLIQTDALENAIKESLENPDVMGTILKRSGLLEEFVIEAAKECCQLIAAGVVKPEQAIMALHQCQRTRNPIKECLEESGWIEKAKLLHN